MLLLVVDLKGSFIAIELVAHTRWWAQKATRSARQRANLLLVITWRTIAVVLINKSLNMEILI